MLSVTSRADELASAIDLAYRAAEKIHFDGVFFRRDIGAKGVAKSHPSVEL